MWGDDLTSWPGWIGRNLYSDGTNYVQSSSDSGKNWGTTAGVHVQGSDPVFSIVTVPSSEHGLDYSLGTSIASYMRLVVTTAGNVGIGYNNPSDILHLADVATIKFALAGADARQIFDASVGSDWSIGIRSADNDFRISESATSLGTNPRFVVEAGGNVGIGTTTPGAKTDIEIVGVSSTVTTALRLSSSHTGAAGSIGEGTAIEFTSNAGARIAKIAGMGDLNDDGTNNQSGLAFYTQPSAGNLAIRMYIDSNGNVGVNTTTPTEKLHVSVGHIRLTDGYALKGGSTGTLPLIYSNANQVILGDNKVTINANGNLETRPAAPSAYNLVIRRNEAGAYGITWASTNYHHARIEGYVAGTGNAAGELRFFTGGWPTSVSISEAMRITSVGNVGIGTTPTVRRVFTVAPTAKGTPNAAGWENVVFAAGAGVTINHNITTSFIGVDVEVPNIIIGTGSVVNAATLRVQGAPTEATNNYSLWVDAGISRFDGAVRLAYDVSNYADLQANSGGDLLITPSGSEVIIADGKILVTDQVRAYDASGLKLYEDGGRGIFVEDATGIIYMIYQSACSVYLASDQNINANVDTVVEFDTELYDTQGEFNPATHTFTAKGYGKYLVTAQANFSVAAQGDTLWLGILVNDVEYAEVDRVAYTDFMQSLSISKVFNLAAGHTIKLYVRNANNNDVIQSEYRWTSMTITKLH